MNQIVAYDKINDAAGLEMFGNAICRSGMFGCESKEAGIVFALQCIAENKPPLEMAKNYHLVKGKLTKRAGLVRSGSAWDKTPAAMLRARCVSETLRAIAPEIVQGVYVPEEIDVDKATEVKPAQKPTVKAIAVEAEVVEAKAVQRPHLESLIKDNDMEYAVNVYWTKKGNIDLDLDQTWRDLPDGLMQRMEMHFDSFRKAIAK